MDITEEHTRSRASAAFSVEDIARVVHAANREIQVITGDPLPSAPWESTPEDIREVAIAGVRGALAGETPEESHAGWCRNKAAQGWRRGEFKSAEAKTHPALVPYSELPPEQLVKDAVFTAIAGAMSGRRPVLAVALAAVDRFEKDLGFTAPELIGMRIGELRSAIREAFEDEEDEDDQDPEFDDFAESAASGADL